MGFHAPHPLGILILNSDHEIHAASYCTTLSLGWRSASALRSEFEIREGHDFSRAAKRKKKCGLQPLGTRLRNPATDACATVKSGAPAPRKLRLKEPAFLEQHRECLDVTDMTEAKCNAYSGRASCPSPLTVAESARISILNRNSASKMVRSSWNRQSNWTNGASLWQYPALWISVSHSNKVTGKSACEIMNRTGHKSEESANPRGIDMIKTSQTELDNLDRFMATMARVLGIPRKKLNKFMFRGQTQPSFERKSTAGPRSNRRSSLAVK